jgi:hypothetical protein
MIVSGGGLPRVCKSGYSKRSTRRAFCFFLLESRRMFTLLFESETRVMLIRYSGILSSDDIRSVDAYVTNFVAGEGYIRSIYDLTRIKAFAIPPTILRERGRKLRMNPGQDRVFVTPQEELYALYCEYAREQLELGNGDMKVVRQLPEALKVLELKKPDFRPLRWG